MNKQNGQLLNFLKKENQILKDDIKSMQEILKLNKQALHVSLNYKSQENYEKSIPQLIKLLYEENNHLRTRIQQLQHQIQTGLCQALISDQIALASTQQQVLLTNQLKDKLAKMRKELENKQKKIVQLTKVTIDGKNSFKKEKSGTANTHSSHSIDAIRLVEYSDMNKVTKKLKDQIQKLTQQLDQKKQQLQRMKDGKQELFKLNLILTKQLNELKFLTSCQTTKSNNNEMSIEKSSNDLTRYIKYQKKLVNQEQNIYEDEGSSSGKNSQNSQSQLDESDQEEMLDQMNSQSQYDQNQKEQESRVQKNQNSENQSPIQNKKANQSMQINSLKFASTLNQKSFSDLGQKNKMNMTLNLANLSLKKNSQSQSKVQQNKPKFAIPKLELTKAKQIQNLIVKKINNDEKKKKQGSGAPVKQQKYKKLEQELQNLRKKMGNQILQKLSYERQCNFLKKIIAELEQRNLLLVQRAVKQQQQSDYEKKRRHDLDDNIETLLDICRDVTMNQRLRRIVLGKQELLKKDIESFEV